MLSVLDQLAECFLSLGDILFRNITFVMAMFLNLTTLLRVVVFISQSGYGVERGLSECVLSG